MRVDPALQTRCRPVREKDERSIPPVRQAPPDQRSAVQEASLGSARCSSIAPISRVVNCPASKSINDWAPVCHRPWLVQTHPCVTGPVNSGRIIALMRNVSSPTTAPALRTATRSLSRPSPMQASAAISPRCSIRVNVRAVETPQSSGPSHTNVRSPWRSHERTMLAHGTPPCSTLTVAKTSPSAMAVTIAWFLNRAFVMMRVIMRACRFGPA